MDLLRQHPQTRTASLLVQLGEVLLVGADVGLPVGVLEDLYLLEGPLDVLLSDARPAAHVGQGVVLAPVLPDEVDEPLRPP